MADTERVAARIPLATVHRLQRLRAALAARVEGSAIEVSLSDAIKTALDAGLSALEGQPEEKGGKPPRKAK